MFFAMLLLRGQHTCVTRSPFVCASCLLSGSLDPRSRRPREARALSTSPGPAPAAQRILTRRHADTVSPGRLASPREIKPLGSVDTCLAVPLPKRAWASATTTVPSAPPADETHGPKKSTKTAGGKAGTKSSKKPKGSAAATAKTVDDGDVAGLSNALGILKRVLTKPGVSITLSSDVSQGSETETTASTTTGDRPKDRTALSPKPSTLKKRPLMPTGVPETNIGKWKQPMGSRYSVQEINSKRLELVSVGTPPRNVPSLQYGLDRALFNPGVYHLQDPRSKVYNFDPYLAEIMPLEQFDFNALRRYITSSKDENLIKLAKKYKKRYTGSTSSMTSMLAQFHYLLSHWRPINPVHTSRAFAPESYNFTQINRAPAATFMHWKDGVYAIDADKEFDTATILTMLGQSMEKLLTLPTEEYERYRKDRSHELTEDQRTGSEAFHYSVLGDFLMRSQLDAHDRRLPGSGMFDLKTRSVVSIRMDARAFHKGLGYEIRSRIGQWQSFEREYYDMIRAAFLKYSLQVRMGRMDGIYVAFHNTQRIFGFQFISINEMDLALHGTEDRTLGDREFLLSLHLLNKVLDKAAERFPGRTLRLHIETRPSDSAPFMYIFAKPVGPDEIQEVQEAGKQSIAEFEREVLGLGPRKAESESTAETVEDEDDSPEEGPSFEDAENGTAQQVRVWEKLRHKVEETMENEALGFESIRDTLEDALEQSGLLRARSAEESRRYVDALLHAITNPEPAAVAKTLHRDALKNVIVEDADADAAALDEACSEEQVDGAAEAMGVSAKDDGDLSRLETSGNPPRSDEVLGEDEIALADGVLTKDVTEPLHTVTTASDAAVSKYEEGVVDEDQATVDEAQGQKQDEVTLGPESHPSNLPIDNISLKSLILKLAEQIEATSGQDGEGEDVQSETTLLETVKNKRFERILSEMVATANKLSSSPSSTSADKPTPSETEPESAKGPAPPEELLGMVLTIRNKMAGEYVMRPDAEEFHKGSQWTVEYAIEELPQKRAVTLYAKCKERRKRLLHTADNETEVPAQRRFQDSFMQKLYRLSEQGRAFRRSENARAKTRPVEVYGSAPRPSMKSTGEKKSKKTE